MYLKKTSFKLFLIVSVFSVLIFFIKKSNKPQPYFIKANKSILEKHSSTSYYFIGSSRVQKSVDPNNIKSTLGTQNIFNIGISGATFLENTILADYIIKTPNRKVLFIELSPILSSFSKTSIQFYDTNNMTPFKTLNLLTNSLSLSKRLNFNFNIYNSYLFSKIAIREDIKNLINPQLDIDNRILMGYSPVIKNDTKSLSSFLTYQEMMVTDYSSVNFKNHYGYIDHLINLSKKHNTKIVFFLPLTYRSQKEKNIVIPLFRSLPKNMKLEYSKKFLDSMRNPKYLSDINHFNEAGAQQYSSLLFPLLKDFLY